MCRVVCWEGADGRVKMWQGVGGGGQNVAGCVGGGGQNVAGCEWGSQNAFPPTLLERVG